LSVGFSINGGSPLAATDNKNGTYTAVFTPTATGTYKITATINGQAVSGATTLTAFFLPATISGTVFQDFNTNSTQDAGEPGIAGRIVYVDLNNSGGFMTGDPFTTTDANGNYQLTVTNPGAYTVREVLYGGDLQVVGNNAQASYQVTVTSGGAISGINFADVLTSIVVKLNSPQPPFPAQGNPFADFVEAVYRSLLNRNADAGGLASWTKALQTKAMSSEQFIQAVWYSQEHLTDEVTGYYNTILGRAPDAGGLANWVSALLHGASEEQVVLDFLTSPEFLSRGDKLFVDQMYDSLLGREADPSGEAYWLAQLGDNASGVHNSALPPNSPSQYMTVAKDILFSTESLTRLVEGNYQMLLDRSADAGGFESWLQQLQDGTPFAAISQAFLGSPEFFKDAAAHG
jgi:hypothetical protein